MVAEPRGDFLTRGPRPLCEERAQAVAGLRVSPPVLADLTDEVIAQLRRADPRPQIVGRVEAPVHVGEVGVGAIANARCLGETLFVAVRRAAVLVEPSPEVELELQLGRIAAVENRLEERGRLRVPYRLVVGKAEVVGMPLGLARDRLEDV